MSIKEIVYEGRQHRLPTGGWTRDMETYCAAWNRLGEEVVKFFPGYTVTGFDPKVHLARYEPTRDGKAHYVDSIVLSVMACMALITGKEPERVTREDM